MGEMQTAQPQTAPMIAALQQAYLQQSSTPFGANIAKSVGATPPTGDIAGTIRKATTESYAPSLTGMDPRFFDDSRYPPIQRKLALDTPEGGNRGYIVEMASPGNEEQVKAKGGWDSAPVGTGKPEDWYDNGPKRISVGFTADMPDKEMKIMMHKLAVLPPNSNMGTGAGIGEGQPNFTDDWMYKNVKDIVGKSKDVTPEMIKEFRRRLVMDPNHRAEMVY